MHVARIFTIKHFPQCPPDSSSLVVWLFNNSVFFIASSAAPGGGLQPAALASLLATVVSCRHLRGFHTSRQYISSVGCLRSWSFAGAFSRTTRKSLGRAADLQAHVSAKIIAALSILAHRAKIPRKSLVHDSPKFSFVCVNWSALNGREVITKSRHERRQALLVLPIRGCFWTTRIVGYDNVWRCVLCDG